MVPHRQRDIPGRLARRRRSSPGLERLERRALLATFSVVNVADSGPGSFRQAIVDANATPGRDSIVFNTPLPALAVFRPTSPLPSITDPVSIDATTEPGYVDRPIVTLDGQVAGPNANGLVFLGGQSTLRGMAVTGFGGYGVILSQGGGDSLQGNYIGVDVTGEASVPNRSGGVLILGGSNNTIGSPTSGGGNVISGNGGDGLRIAGPTPGLSTLPASGNQILANFVGLDSTGTNRIGNALDGIHLINATANAIGGTGFGLGNLISGNAGNGLEIEGDASYAAATGGFNRVQGNTIGTDRQTHAGLGNAQDGVRVAASANTIGGSVGGAANLIANNAGDGVRVAAQRVPILSNAIFGNAGVGIALWSNAANGGQKPPTIASLTGNGNSVVVTGTIEGAPGVAEFIQFFGNFPGETQARNFLGSAYVTPSGSGFTAFSFNIPNGVPVGGNVTATVTDQVGDTSPLSATQADAPRVLDVALSPNRTEITVNFSTLMDSSTTSDPRNYRVNAPRAVAIRQVTHATDGLSISILLKKAIPTGTFGLLSIVAGSGAGVTSSQGVMLDGDGDGQPGGAFHGSVAVASNIHYTDAARHAVSLQLAHGGVIEAYRSTNGNAQTVRLYGAIAGRSVLSGSVKGKNAVTPIAVLSGLNGANNRLTNPPFQIGQTV